VKLYSIDAPHFYAGLEIEKNSTYLDTFYYSTYKVVKAAPIIKYMVGWTKHNVENYCNKKGWKLNEIYKEGVDMV